METVVLIVLALVVAAVAIDAIARLDERPYRWRRPERDESLISTQKIVIDLSKRR
jgi:hypothetical protein